MAADDIAEIKYFPSDMPITYDNISHTERQITARVPLAPIRDQMTAVLRRYDETRGARFQYSFYTAFGIPPYAYIQISDYSPWDATQAADDSAKLKIILTCFYPNIAYFGSPTITDQPSNFIIFNYRRSLPLFIGNETNKIHLFVKHDYILYVVRKLATLHTDYPANNFRFKFQLFNRISNLQPGNTGIRDIRADGGPVPTIVIYGSSDYDTMAGLIVKVLDLFPEHDEIGLMELRDTATISPFNVRLNRLVSYAAGDRSHTLDGIADGTIRPRPLPEWFSSLQARCRLESGLINEKSQLYLGLQGCDLSNNPIDYGAFCSVPANANKLFCYLPPELLDPHLFEEMTDEDILAEERASAALVAGARSTKKRTKRRKHRSRKSQKRR